MQRRGRGFDAFRLAAAGETLAGRLDPRALPRLEDRVAGAGGEVGWSIHGGADPDGRPAITVTVDGSVPLTCQRCLGVVVEHVAQRTLLLLARDDAELVRLDEASEHEVVAAREPLDPVALVEDELLLSLPYAPRHASDCAPPGSDAR